MRILISMLVSMLVLAPVVWLLAQRITRPIRAFAEAAERLGADPDAEPLTARGPTEVRTAIAAFNEMQDAIRGHIRKRTQTVAAIAHDLRTPLTRLRFRAEQAPEALRDRMEIIELHSYTTEEKVKIAQGYLVPRQIRENALRPDEISFEEEALRRIVRDYTREAGVRSLERTIGTICRKVATKVAENGVEDPIVITPDNLVGYLKKPRFFDEVAERTEIPGVATGLAWTMTGDSVARAASMIAWICSMLLTLKAPTP